MTGTRCEFHLLREGYRRVLLVVLGQIQVFLTVMPVSFEESETLGIQDSNLG